MGRIVCALGVHDETFTLFFRCRVVAFGVAALPDDGGVILVENDLARRYIDPGGEVFASLSARRPLLAEIPCHPKYGGGLAIYCTRMVLFGPARPTTP